MLGRHLQSKREIISFSISLPKQGCTASDWPLQVFIGALGTCRIILRHTDGMTRQAASFDWASELRGLCGRFRLQGQKLPDEPGDSTNLTLLEVSVMGRDALWSV